MALSSLSNTFKYSWVGWKRRPIQAGTVQGVDVDVDNEMPDMDQKMYRLSIGAPNLMAGQLNVFIISEDGAAEQRA